MYVFAYLYISDKPLSLIQFYYAFGRLWLRIADDREYHKWISHGSTLIVLSDIVLSYT